MDEIGSHVGRAALAWEAIFALAVALVGVCFRHLGSLKKRQGEREAQSAESRADHRKQLAEAGERMAMLESSGLRAGELRHVHERADGLTREVHSMSAS